MGSVVAWWYSVTFGNQRSRVGTWLGPGTVPLSKTYYLTVDYRLILRMVRSIHDNKIIDLDVMP